MARLIDGSFAEHTFTRLEKLAKLFTSGCMQCGDCAILGAAFISPMSQCPSQHNGPCGGSIDGWCEVYPQEKECLYVRAYRGLKQHAEEGALVEGQVPPVDYDLRHTSSWLNFYAGRDHTAKRLGSAPPGRLDKT